MNQLVFATENPGKLREGGKFAAQYGVEILSPSQAGLTPNKIEETGETYEENARIKVESYLRQEAAKKFVICGDDSGMEINALNGEPGVSTRRWLGYEMNDDEIVDYALEKLKGESNRGIVARSVIAYSMFAQPVQFIEGEMEGRIVTELDKAAPEQKGFPFERLFVVSGDPEIPLWRFDELSIDERDSRLSHRESAFLKLFQALDWVK